MDLKQFGWSPFFEEHFRTMAQPGLEAARVVVEHRGGYRLYSAGGEVAAEVSGRFRHEAVCPSQFPAVGDWVVMGRCPGEKKAIIQAVLPRRTKFSRTAAGERAEEQVLAANIDLALIVASLSAKLRPRSIERYLTLAWESKAEPIIVLTKADLCRDVKSSLRQVEAVIVGVKAHTVSGVTGEGMGALTDSLCPGQTGVLLGPSGVGKSTLINYWCGQERLKVQSVRAGDGKGRHTTSQRELICLPSGVLMMDTPGMRELQLWEGEQGMEEVFADIELLAGHCRFPDCQHNTEPDCAVQAAVEQGKLGLDRLESHRKLKRELRHFAEKSDKHAQAEARRASKAVTRSLRSFYKSGT